MTFTVKLTPIVTVRLRLENDDSYSGSITINTSPKQRWEFSELRQPKAWSESLDSPKAFKAAARSACSFGSYYTSDNRGEDTPTWAPTPGFADSLTEFTIDLQD